MPELPEVETIKNILNDILPGKVISSVEINREKSVLGDPKTFMDSLKGKKILEIGRKGKYLIFYLADDYVIISHLRMEGKYYLEDEKEDDTKYARIVYHFTDGSKLCFDDSRSFGITKLTKKDQYLDEKELKTLGLEPFSIENVDYLIEKTKNISTPIKSTLLDQSIIAGLGNIYADEVLFLSGINPMEKAKKLTREDWEKVLTNSIDVLNKAIKEGGSTIRSYHPGKGIDGNFQTQLNVYGKKGEPCPKCGHKLYYKKIGGRGSTFCPRCQAKKNPPIYYGLTGPLSAGKSTVLDICKKLGVATLSADDIVHELYKNGKVIKKINQITSQNFEGEVNRELLRDYLIENPRKVKQVDNYIHPLVKERIISEMTRNKKEKMVVEVPLLFEAGFDNLFDYNIAVSINEDSRKSHIKTSDLLKLNKKDNDFYTSQADIIIENNSDLKSLEKEVSDKLLQD
ncbi:MAG: DNA-formamidopyrimidine glycosylase [Coprobacillus sp.]|nr:DNA-formamidopyrimidine glycosylase [Coprobacillus sp.]